jgi:hypothetical protein
MIDVTDSTARLAPVPKSIYGLAGAHEKVTERVIEVLDVREHSHDRRVYG